MKSTIVLKELLILLLTTPTVESAPLLVQHHHFHAERLRNHEDVREDDCCVDEPGKPVNGFELCAHNTCNCVIWLSRLMIETTPIY